MPFELPPPESFIERLRSRCRQLSAHGCGCRWWGCRGGRYAGSTLGAPRLRVHPHPTCLYLSLPLATMRSAERAVARPHWGSAVDDSTLRRAVVSSIVTVARTSPRLARTPLALTATEGESGGHTVVFSAWLVGAPAVDRTGVALVGRKCPAPTSQAEAPLRLESALVGEAVRSSLAAHLPDLHGPRTPHDRTEPRRVRWRFVERLSSPDQRLPHRARVLGRG